MKIPWKWLWSVMLVGSLLFTNLVAVEASDSSVDLTKKGSITVQLQSKETTPAPIAGGQVSLYKVATVASKNGLLEYTYTSDFAGCGMALDDLRAAQLPEQLMAWADQEQVPALAQKTTGADGKAVFDNLDMALYLVRQNGAVGGYWPMDPFVVALPMTNAAGTGWDYDVLAQPKVVPTPPYVPPTPSPDPDIDPDPDASVDPSNPDKHSKRLRVEKVWSDSDKEHAPVTVKLYRRTGENNGEYVESVTLDADNQWTHEWTSLDGHSEWYVLEVDVPKNYKVSYDNAVETKTVITNTADSGTPGGKLPPGGAPGQPPQNGSGTPLIQTGQLRWPIPVLAIAGVLLTSIGWMLRRRDDE